MANPRLALLNEATQSGFHPEFNVNTGRIEWVEGGVGDGTGAVVLIQAGPPTAADPGTLWFDSDELVLSFRYSNTWIEIATGGGASGGASVTVSETAPVAAAEGDLWFDNSDTDGVLSVFYADTWVEVGGMGGTGTPVVPVESTLPVASAATRGHLVQIETTNLPDTLWWCARLGNGTYDWVQIA